MNALTQPLQAQSPPSPPRNMEQFAQLMVDNLDFLARLAADDGDHATAQVRKFDSRYIGAELRSFRHYLNQRRHYTKPDAIYASDYTEGDLDQMEFLIDDARNAELHGEHITLLESLRDTLHREIANADRYNQDHTRFAGSEDSPTSDTTEGTSGTPFCQPAPPAPNADDAIARPARDEECPGVATRDTKRAGGA